MTYEKPAVAILADSLKAIQGVPKAAFGIDSGSQQPRTLATVNAYEADE